MRDNESNTPTRVLSVDAFRGFVMLLMMAEVLELWSMAKYFSTGDPAYEFWEQVKHHTTHVEWAGCSLHDLIQPAFTFLVGVAMPFSLANREDKGQSFWWMLFHAVWRSILLIAIGIFLRSIGRPTTNWMFTDTLGQIGLGYTILFLIGYVSQRSLSALSWLVPWGSLAVILVGYWALFAFYPLPGENFDYRTVGVQPAWQASHHQPGFLAHWNKNTNPAMEFDKWFLNLFPREKKMPTRAYVSAVGLLASPELGPLLATGAISPGSLEQVPFRYESGGYATLSFIPTLGTMILGLVAGIWLRSGMSTFLKFAVFVVVGLIGIGLGEAFEYLEICPVVKRIWTPAWTLYSGGWCFLMLAIFYLIVDIIGFWHWAFPLFVLGANSIVAYCANGLFRSFLRNAWQTHLGPETFRYFDTDQIKWERPLLGAAVLLTLFLMLLWMYRNKVFVRI